MLIYQWLLGEVFPKDWGLGTVERDWKRVKTAKLSNAKWQDRNDWCHAALVNKGILHPWQPDQHRISADPSTTPIINWVTIWTTIIIIRGAPCLLRTRLCQVVCKLITRKHLMRLKHTPTDGSIPHLHTDGWTNTEGKSFPRAMRRGMLLEYHFKTNIKIILFIFNFN